MTFEPNQQGIDKLYADIAAKVEGVDQQIRAQWTGKPAEEIEPHAVSAFAAIGVNFPNLTDYAAAVSGDEPFNFVLR